MSDLLSILGSKYPIIQGPIGELNDPKMVAAVCEAGGLGMLALGAQGVQIGTRFLSAAESPASQAWKEAILNCPEGGTTLLPLGGMNVRIIINPRLAEKMNDPNIDLSQEYNMMNMGKAWRSGDFDLFPAGGGQVSASITEIKSVKDIIEEMVS